MNKNLNMVKYSPQVLAAIIAAQSGCFVPRTRKIMSEIYTTMGDIIFRRAFRMSYITFLHLFEVIHNFAETKFVPQTTLR